MENIQVAVRIRPDPEPSIWTLQDSHVILNAKELLSRRPLQGARNTFAYDQCYGAETQNKTVYQQQVKNLVHGSLNGINATVFMYGQTGSGKTYTMLGQAENAGILPQSFRDLFELIDKDLNKTYVLRCSYFEIYNEQIYDLLRPPCQLQESLQVNEDSKKEFYVKGLIEQSVSSIGEIFEVLKKGEFGRHYAQTAMNHNSSRSHAIFRLYVQSITNNFIRNYRREQSQQKMQTLDQMEAQDAQEPQELSQTTSNFQIEESITTTNYQSRGALVTESVLNFVDLAGSEKVSNHFDENTDLDTNRRVKEGQYINKSLFFLTQVIFMKAEDKGHIPYRNSSLTKILRSSLDGHSRTLIILCINPTANQFEYSISTLRFGMNAKKIETKVMANIKNQDDDEALKILLSDYEKKLRDVEKIRLEEKEHYESQIISLEKENHSLQNRLIKQNKTEFEKIPQLYQDISWNDRFKNDLHVEGAGDIIQTARKVHKPKEHDCSGKIVLAALKKTKSNYKQLVANYDIVKLNFQSLKNDNQQLQLTLNQSINQYTELNTKYNELFNYAESMKNQLSFQVQELDIKQLLDLREFYSQSLSTLTTELKQRNSIQQIQQFDVSSFKIKQDQQIIVQVQEISQMTIQQSIIDLDKTMFNNVQQNMMNNSSAKNILENSSAKKVIQQQSKSKSSRSISIGSLESGESFKITYPVHQEFKQQEQTLRESTLSEINFKSALQSFISEIEHQPLKKSISNSTQKKTATKYKTPDTKFKKQSTSQTSIRGKQNVEPRKSQNVIPKPRSRMKTEELSILLNKAQMQKQ